MKVVAILIAFIVTWPSGALAQFSHHGNVKIRVTYTNDRPITTLAKVQLVDSAGNPVAETFTDHAGGAEFGSVEVGKYHVIVSGQGIDTTDSGVFEVDERRTSQYLSIAVRPSGEQENRAAAANATVSAANLKIPQNARREFDKAAEFMAKEQWRNAVDRLDLAVEIYPKYVEAYTNLGVAYSHLEDPAKEREAFQKAIAINDHFAPALVNLARLDIKQRDFPAAEDFLNKAVVVDPQDVPILTLLANVELLDKHYDAAIATCRQVHALAHQSYALVHYIAARAFEHENQLSEAAAEFETFLREEPSGARAEAVRKELAAIQAHLPH